MNLFIKYKSQLGIFSLTALFTLIACIIVDHSLQIYEAASISNKICVPIVMYHHVKNSGLGKDAITPQEFENDLKYLKENNFNTITMSQLIDYVYEDIDLPQNPIVLSFDDGYYNTYKYVYPLLKQYDCKIVLSIIGKSTDDFSRVNENNENYSHLTWDQIIEMEQSGHAEIQNHTYDLHKIKNGRFGCYPKSNESFEDYESLLSNDIYILQDKAEMLLSKSPSTFTYPYGKYNSSTDKVIHNLGFKATLSVTFGVNLIDKDPQSLYDLKRICRAHKDPIGKLIKEAMETLRFTHE